MAWFIRSKRKHKPVTMYTHTLRTPDCSYKLDTMNETVTKLAVHPDSRFCYTTASLADLYTRVPRDYREHSHINRESSR